MLKNLNSDDLEKEYKDCNEERKGEAPKEKV